MKQPSQKEYKQLLAMAKRAQKMADDFMTDSPQEQIMKIIKNHKAWKAETDAELRVVALEIEELSRQAIASRDKEWEKACRLYLQNAWNDQSQIQALSPKGKTIIWGGIIGKQITTEWLKIAKHMDQAI